MLRRYSHSRLGRLALRAFVIALAVPVMMAGARVQPAAAAEGGGWGEAVVDVGSAGFGFGVGATCWVAAAYGDVDKTQLQWAAGECTGGLDGSLFAAQPGEPGSGYTLIFNGLDANGGACAAGGGGTLGEHPKNGWTVWGSYPAGSGSLFPGGCDVQEVCVTLDGEGPFSDPETGCAPIDIPDGAGATCAHGNPTKVERTIFNNDEIQYTITWDRAVTVQYPGGWGKVGMTPRDDRGPSWSQGTGIGATTNVWVYYWPTAIGSRAQDGIGFTIKANVHGSWAGNSLYVNDPGNCKWWFGVKMFDNGSASDVTDEPMAAVGVDVPSGPGPAPTPPATDDNPLGDEPSFWAALLQAMAHLIRAVGGIAQAFWTLAFEGLQLLFIPDVDDFGWEGFVEQARARPPASIVLDLGDAVQALSDGYQSAGSCGTLADFSGGDGSGLVVTCSQVRSIPGYNALYFLVRAGLYGATAFGIFRMFQSSLGGRAS